jgi:hypothetical protein
MLREISRDLPAEPIGRDRIPYDVEAQFMPLEGFDKARLSQIAGRRGGDRLAVVLHKRQGLVAEKCVKMLNFYRVTHCRFPLRVETDVDQSSLLSVLARSLHEINYWDICQPKTK